MKSVEISEAQDYRKSFELTVDSDGLSVYLECHGCEVFIGDPFILGQLVEALKAHLDEKLSDSEEKVTE